MGKFKKADALTALGAMTDEEVYVFSPTEYNTTLDTYRNSEIETALKGRTAKMYNDFDADFGEATGLKKPDNEKTYKYWVRMLKEYMEKAENSDAVKLHAEIERLKTTGGQADKVKELEQIIKTYETKTHDADEQIKTLTESLKQKDVANHIESGLRGFKFQKIAEPVIKTFIESAKRNLMAKAKVVDGVIVFVDDKGEPRINRETMKPYTAEELLAVELEPILDKGKEGVTGLGTHEKPAIVKDKEGKQDINLIMPANVKTKVELTEYLIKSGLPFNSEEHNVAYDKYSKELNLS